jgi:hypothetical protein
MIHVQCKTIMETSNTNLTAERSLEVISKTLEQSRRKITRDSWRNMLLWGIAVTVIALVVGHLWQHTSMRGGANVLWALLGLVALFEWWQKRQRTPHPQTFLSKQISIVWSSMGYMACAIGIIFGIMAGANIDVAVFGQFAPYAMNIGHFPITAVIIMIMGICGVIHGRMLRNTPITVCCFIAGLFGSLAAVIFRGPYEMVVLAIVSVVALIVPAIIIKMKEE